MAGTSITERISASYYRQQNIAENIDMITRRIMSSRLVKSLTSLMVAENIPPPFSTAAAAFILIAYTVVYVAPFYLTPTTRPSPLLSRDSPTVIRARIRSVIISCAICSTSTFVALLSYKRSRDGVFIALHNMGYYPIGFTESAYSLLLLFQLFLGPLFEAGIAEGAWRDWIRLRGSRDLFGSWIGYRNLVAGPVTEEILFRSAAIPLFLLSRASVNQMIFITPLIFGLAHIHHMYEFRITHPNAPLAEALGRTVFQLLYTWLFGAYCTFVYLRTGSLLSVMLAHAFCNWMGLPRFWGRVGASVETVTGPDCGDDGKRDPVVVGSGEAKSISVLWSMVYYLLLFTGAVLFYRNMWALTTSEAALVDFGARK